MTADPLTSVRELDCRWTSGIQIRLLWCPSDGRLSVAVTDTRSCESCVIHVPHGESPLDVFNHPFAYGTPRRVQPESRQRTSEQERERAAG